jgi:transposase
VIVFSSSQREKSENERLVRFRNRTDRWYAFNWSTVIKTTTLLGVSRATISKVMSEYTNRGKATAAKRNNGRKSTLTEKDLRMFRKTVSRNHTTAATQMTPEQNVQFEDSVSRQTV